MRDTGGEAKKNSLEMFFYMDVPALVYQQELIYISPVRTQNIVWKTCRERWMIGTGEEREPGKSVLSGRLDDNDDDDDDNVRFSLNDISQTWKLAKYAFFSKSFNVHHLAWYCKVSTNIAKRIWTILTFFLSWGHSDYILCYFSTSIWKVKIKNLVSR